MSRAPALPVQAGNHDRVASLRDQRVVSRGYLATAWRRLRANQTAMAGLVVLIIMVLIALFADLLAVYVTHQNTYEQDLMARFVMVGADGYLLGGDALGRDVATRLIYGARVSLAVAGLSIVGALIVGIGIGTLAGHYGGWVDNVLMRLVDIMLAIPTLFLLLLIASLWRMGPVVLAVVISAVAWVTLSRLVRGEVVSLARREYVEAARVLGAGNNRIMLRHILPNVVPIVIVWAGLTVPRLIVWEATLSYLGLGIQQPTPSWGNMLSDAQRVWNHSLSLVFLPGAAIFVTVFAINLLGNGLRDALDPRTV